MAGSPVAGSPVAGSLGANYDLQSMLGSGGQGEVYLASDQHQQRAVAIKFSLRDKASRLKVLISKRVRTAHSIVSQH